MTKSFKIGTRGSPLAVAQTNILVEALKAEHLHLRPAGAVEVITIITSGDMSQASNQSLSETGGKGLFTKEIEEALLDGRIDCAVHSMKDMPTVLPDGLEISCLMKREDPRDAFFSNHGHTIHDLPQGAIVGTSSLRRQAIILSQRPDLKVVTFRGNVGTRLQKLKDGVVDATLLAVAGLNRLGMSDVIQTILEPHVMLPAVAQGAVGIETRIGDSETQNILAAVHCAVTELRVTAERAFLAVMDGSCRTPLGALMTEPDADGNVRFEALFATPDGTDVKKVDYVMTVKTLDDATRLGQQAGADLKKLLV